MSPEDIDRLTIAEVRAISERASEAMARFREVQAMIVTMGGGPQVGPIPAAPGVMYSLPRSTQAAGPFPCSDCGRTAPERPGELLQPVECQLCGNHLPGSALLTNKGAFVLTPEERARRAAMPAFTSDGEPVAEESL